MMNLAKEGKTILFTSHNVRVIENLTSKCLFLQGGKLISQGNTSEVVDAYMQACTREANGLGRNTIIREILNVNRPVEFEKFEFANKRGFLIFTSEPFKFRVTLKAFSDCENIRMCLSIYQQSGGIVGSFFGPIIHKIQKNESAVFEFEIFDHHLAAGTYFCGAVLTQGDYQKGENKYDSINNILQFEVTETAASEKLYTQWKPIWGGIRFNEPKMTRIGIV